MRLMRLVLCLLLALVAAPARADVGQEIWRCVHPDRKVYVTNDKAETIGNDCRVISMTYRTTGSSISVSVLDMRKSGGCQCRTSAARMGLDVHPIRADEFAALRA